MTAGTEAVRLYAGDMGTEVRWHVHAPNIASLIHVGEILHECSPPFFLRFNAGGWFEEHFTELQPARNRIDDLIIRGDRYLPGRIFVREEAADPEAMPALLQDVWLSRVPAEDYAIECGYEPAQEQFVVRNVGPKSAIARIWGTQPTSWPCQSLGSYNQTTNASYERAVAEKRPLYEHVLAMFRFPDSVQRWVPYHRLILPRLENTHDHAVSVVSACAEVGFKVL